MPRSRDSKLARSPLPYHYPEERLFGDLPEDALKTLASISIPATYPKGAVLFVEGEAPRGLFVISSGRAKLSTSSPEGKKIILRLAERGQVVGLAGTISGKPYAVTAESLEEIQANFIPRQPFLQFLREHGEAALRVAQLLGEVVHATYDDVRTLGLSRSAEEKLASFLLSWMDQHGPKRGEARVSLTLTHEEIAEMIGATRETVTRLLTDFRKRQLIQVEGSNLVIQNRAGLEGLIRSQRPAG